MIFFIPVSFFFNHTKGEASDWTQDSTILIILEGNTTKGNCTQENIQGHCV